MVNALKLMSILSSWMEIAACILANLASTIYEVWRSIHGNQRYPDYLEHLWQLGVHFHEIFR